MELVFGHDQVPGKIAVISDITAAPTSSVSRIKLPRLGVIGAVFKRGDTAIGNPPAGVAEDRW